ncbi:MAG: hypothetical protein J6I79_09705 [Paludibacteraceae bacterium]|nr:hypothetical protein [Paludibacteraceae bacterium]
MPISADFPLQQVVGAVNLLLLTVVVLAPVLVYRFTSKRRGSCWTYFLIALPLSAAAVLGGGWLDDYSTSLLLESYGYNEGLVNEYANVLPENMEKVDLLLGSHVSFNNSFLLLLLAIDALYCVMVFFLLNIVKMLFRTVR